MIFKKEYYYFVGFHVRVYLPLRGTDPLWDVGNLTVKVSKKVKTQKDIEALSEVVKQKVVEMANKKSQEKVDYNLVEITLLSYTQL